MKNFLRIAHGVNVTPLMLAISRRPDLWAADTFLRHYPQGPFGEVESIMLRFPERPLGLTEEQVDLYKQNLLPGYDQHESVDQPAYAVLTEARPLVMSIFQAAAGERLGRVMINKIAPGGCIFPHADTPEHANYYSRFHLVLQSGEGCRFRAGDEWTQWESGAVFWFNNKLEHEVINDGPIDRIHMVIDARCSK